MKSLKWVRCFNINRRGLSLKPIILLFTALTHNPQPLHLDAEFAKQSQYGQILVNSLYTLGLVVGLSVADTTLGTTIGNLGMEQTEVP